MKGNSFLVLCGVVKRSDMVVMVVLGSCRYMNEHLAKQGKHNGLWDEKEKPIGVSFTLIAS